MACQLCQIEHSALWTHGGSGNCDMTGRARLFNLPHIRANGLENRAFSAHEVETKEVDWHQGNRLCPLKSGDGWAAQV